MTEDAAQMRLRDELEVLRDKNLELQATTEELERIREALQSSESIHRELSERFRRQQDAIIELAKHPSVVAGDLTGAARAATEAVARALEVERVSVWLLNETATELLQIDLFERSTATHGSGFVLDSGDYPRYFEALERERGIDAHDARSDPRTSEFTEGYLTPHGITSMLDAGIRISGRLTGVVCHEHVGPTRTWHGDELAFAGAVADQLALTMLNTEQNRGQEELRRKERELERANQMFRLVLDTIPVRVFWKDRNLRYLGCSGRFAEDGGRATPEEVVGLDDYAMSWRDQADLYRSDDRSVMESGQEKIDFEEPQTTPDGDQWLRTSKVPLRNLKNEIIGVLGTYEDITERKRNEEELVRYRDRLQDLVQERTEELEAAQQKLIVTERLAALGRLTATMAHEIRNPLGTVRTSVFSIGDALTRGDPNRATRAIHLAERNIKRIDNIIEELLDFSRHREIRAAPLEVDPWLKRLLSEQTVPGGLELRLECGAGITVSADREQLRRAVINILQNAMQAASEKEAVGTEIWLRSRVDGSHLLVEVEDRGPGIPPDLLEKIREPLFSTKSFGVGLGLPIVDDIMEKHGGELDLRSGADGGTVATLRMPVGGKE